MEWQKLAFFVHCFVSTCLANQPTTVLKLGLRKIGKFDKIFFAFFWFILPRATYLPIQVFKTSLRHLLSINMLKLKKTTFNNFELWNWNNRLCRCDAAGRAAAAAARFYLFKKKAPFATITASVMKSSFLAASPASKKGSPIK